MDADLADRLRAAGVDPADPGDPAAAWQRLHDREGFRATLLDRYALEAHSRGIRVEELDAPLRARATREVLEAHQPGFEWVGGSDGHVLDPIEVVDYDPAWPRHYAGWRDRLASELGPVAVRIEHVSSTSVPGLAARPVIDIQVSVPDIADEAAYVPAIGRCGIGFRSRRGPAPDDG